jgi:hypothetical protein
LGLTDATVRAHGVVHFTFTRESLCRVLVVEVPAVLGCEVAVVVIVVAFVLGRAVSDAVVPLVS